MEQNQSGEIQNKNQIDMRNTKRNRKIFMRNSFFTKNRKKRLIWKKLSFLHKIRKN